jgi:hypothetical protein
MHGSTFGRLALATVMVALIGGRPVGAAPAADWPCIQPRVAELSAATFWGGPPLDDSAAKAWRDNPDVAKLVTDVVSRRLPIEGAETMIASYAGAHKGDKDRLTLVFAGAFAELNSLRTRIVLGIERFARNQRQLSDQLNQTRAELNGLTAAPEKTEPQRARIQELQTRIQWQTRLHNERQNSLRYVCETPVLLEQRIFAIARAVQNEM